MKHFTLSLILALILVTEDSGAFPEMVRHGYIHCTTCHVSPSGGGLMTPYGRSLSKELLSRWSYEGEENLLHGAIKNENILNWVNGVREVGFNVGGDIRYLQLYRNSRFVEEGKFITMQRDMEVAFRFYNISIVSTAGVIEKNDKDEFDSRRAYVLYQANENISLRAGRFIPIYGLMIPDHNVATRQGLGFNQGSERNSAELNYIQDQWSATATFSQTPDSYDSSVREKAGALQLNYAIADKYKVGVSHWRGQFENEDREIYGIHGILGFTHDWYLLSEIDYQVQRPDAASARRGIFYFQKLGYEFTRGLHAIAQLEGSQSDFESNTTKTFSYGLGLTFFPRPHFDLQSLVTRTKVQAIDDQEMTVAYLMGHYYF